MTKFLWYLNLSGTLVKTDALMIINTQQTIELTHEHIFQSLSEHLPYEDKPEKIKYLIFIYTRLSFLIEVTY